MNKKIYTIAILFLLLSVNSLYSQTQDSIKYETKVSKALLGCEISAIAVGKSANQSKLALYKAFKEIERIDGKYGWNRKHSLIDLINDSAAIKPIKLDSEAYGLFKRALKYTKKYEELFDASVGAATDFWGFSSDRAIKKPNPIEMDSLLKLVGWKYIKLDSLDSSITILKKGAKIDFGGLAKGFALDRASYIMRQNGERDFVIDAGGDVYASGLNSEGKKWNIGVKSPRNESEVCAIIEASDMAVCTSGDYERYIIIDGERFCHILNPKTGYSPRYMQSSTIVFPSGEEGTVLSKYIFLKGADEYSKTTEANDYFYFIVDSAGKPIYNNDYTKFKEINFELIKK